MLQISNLAAYSFPSSEPLRNVFEQWNLVDRGEGSRKEKVLPHVLNMIEICNFFRGELMSAFAEYDRQNQ